MGPLAGTFLIRPYHLAAFSSTYTTRKPATVVGNVGTSLKPGTDGLNYGDPNTASGRITYILQRKRQTALPHRTDVDEPVPETWLPGSGVCSFSLPG